MRHDTSQLVVETCMRIPVNTLRHIEKNRRALPKLEQGLAGWVKRFLDCVHATPQERATTIELMSRQVLRELSELLDDTEDRQHGDPI
ncbi:MAG TPA: hypothetical protein VGN32_15175 [Ktedonobacterales bacterium]|nr:hypothetical protein [Ktedonobacterales bacterium]